MSKVRNLNKPEQKKSSDGWVVPLIIVLSVAVPAAVAALLMFPDVLSLEMGIERSTLPAFHAILNGTTAILLLLGLGFIRKKNIKGHKRAMLAAFSLSAVFLISYVISKLNAAPVPYGGEGFIRGLYFFILISHIVLSVAVLPLAMFAIYRGLTDEISRHKKIVRWAFPIWLYVAVTGVLVYVFMQPYY